ncbi:DUF418 domain-containing protein [Nocardia testacea]|uniref:DUF418 domain-containing protein n=1 Tax=Nocardia testacea TaxID=248551 RepID=A0ABW7VV80_9NOCA
MARLMPVALTKPQVRARSKTVSGSRDETIDAIRGFALFGILITNAAVLTGILTSDGPVTPLRLWTHDEPVDRLADAIVQALFSGRFYLLFAFLFGYAFVLQLAAAERAGASGMLRMVRRCTALFLLGAAHAALLWVGDILALYALLGIALLLMQKLSGRAALFAGTVLYLVFALLALRPTPAASWDERLGVAVMRAGYAGSPLDTLVAQLSVAPRFVLMTWMGQGMAVLAMFLIGMAAGRFGILQNEQWWRRRGPAVLWVGLGVGLPISAVTFADTAGVLIAPNAWHGVQELINPAMTFAYVYLLMRWCRASSWPVAWLVPAGRMAATNYIGQSVMLMLLYSGYGAGIAERVSAPLVCLLGVLTFGLQLVFSRWWLARHTYGPVEWMLRVVTYRSARPKKSAATAR